MVECITKRYVENVEQLHTGFRVLKPEQSHKLTEKPNNSKGQLQNLKNNKNQLKTRTISNANLKPEKNPKSQLKNLNKFQKPTIFSKDQMQLIF